VEHLIYKLFILGLSILFFTSHVRAVELHLISRSQINGRPSAQDCRYPHVNRKGRYVVFETKASLVRGDYNKRRDVYFYDLKKRKLERIPSVHQRNSNGGPYVSPKGRVVAFHSFPPSVVQGEPPRTADIYLYSRPKEQIELISLSWKGTPHDGEALFPRLAGRNRFVLLTSNGTNLMPIEKIPVRGVYLRDQRKQTWELISQTMAGEPANRVSGDPKISHDGGVVVYKSAATNLVPQRPLSYLSSHLYLRDRKDHTQIQIDTPERGFDNETWVPGRFDMDKWGNQVIFEGRSRVHQEPVKGLLVSDLFLFSRTEDRIQRITPQPFEKRAHSPTLSDNGRYLAFILEPSGEETRDGGLVIMDRKKDQWRVLIGGAVRNPSLSKNGRTLVFESSEGELVSGAISGVLNVYAIINPFWN